MLKQNDKMKNHTGVNPDELNCNWTAEVILNNGQKTTIWHTAWPMRKRTVTEIVSISSDYPKSIRPDYLR